MTKIAWHKTKKEGALFWHVPRVIKFNDTVVVEPDEFVVFYYNGWVIGVFSRPGTYPIVPDLAKRFPKLWNKLTKCREYVEVYYVANGTFESKFGTKQPLMFEDPKFELVQIRGFGQFTFRIQDPVKFVQRYVGQYGCSTADEAEVRIKEQMTVLLNTTLAKLKDRGLTVVKIPGNLNKIKRAMIKLSRREFKPTGLVLTGLPSLNINLPPSINKAINEMSAVAAVSEQTIEKMTKYETMKAIRDGSRVDAVNVNVDQIGDRYDIGQVGDSYETSQTVIQDSVVMRSNIGGGGAQSSSKAGGGSQTRSGSRSESNVTIKDSVVQRSTVGSGEKTSCPSCDGDVQEGWKMCPLCGARLEQKCPNCGGELQAGWRLCPNCGYDLSQ